MSSVSAGGGGNLPGEDLDDMGDVDGELET
jgi:hypothetical protein